MQSGRVILAIVAVAMLACASSGCSGPTYVHAVFFTCQPGTPKERMEAMVADSVGELARIPSVRHVCCGLRDVDMNRPVNVTDFDVGLIVYFDDRRGYETYRKHPIHDDLVNGFKDVVAAMRVFDFLVE